MLRSIATTLASIDALRVEAIEQAFGCTLAPDATDPRQYRAPCPGPPPFDLDVRIGTTGGVVVARFEAALPDGETVAREALGAPVWLDVASPPIHPAPAWTPRRALAFEVDGARIWAGLVGEGAAERLAYLSRTFEAPER